MLSSSEKCITFVVLVALKKFARFWALKHQKKLFCESVEFVVVNFTMTKLKFHASKVRFMYSSISNYE